MILAKISTQKEDIYIIGEDELDARDKASAHFKTRYFTEPIQIMDVKIVACSKKRYSQALLVI